MAFLSTARSKTFSYALAPFLLATSALYAGCPTEDSLGYGVFITYDDGSYSRVTRTDENTMFEDTSYMDGSGDRFANTLEQGILSTMSFDFAKAQIKPVTVAQTTFSGDRFDIDKMKEESEVRLRFERTNRQGTTKGTMVITTGEGRKEEFGKCGYEVVPVSLAETANNKTRTTHLLYIPELGVSILRDIVEPSGKFAEFYVEKIDDDFPWEGRD